MAKGGWKRTMLNAIGLCGVLCAGILIAGCALQKKIIFPGGRDVYRTPSVYGWAYEDVVLPVSGKTTHGWFVPAENARGTVLFSHGNAGTIADRLESIGAFRELGLDVFAYDYGGYGKSTGSVSEQRCYADVRAAWRYLTEQRGIEPKRIVLFGRSLGGGPTVDLAAELSEGSNVPAAAILESTFLSTVKVGRDIFPFLPLRLMIRHRFDNEAKIARVHCPVLVIHSPEDDVISYHHGTELFALANEPKQFVEIHGGHNDGFILSEDIRQKAIDEFLTPLLKQDSP